MATTQELLDKLKANLTSIYDKLESKGVQVSGNKNLDNLVIAIDNVGGGGGGGGITEIATPEEMEAFKVEANVGKYAKYVGETTDTYVNGAIYFVKQEGGGIALFDDSKYSADMDAYVVTSDIPLETPFVDGETININFIVNGGEVQSVPTTWLDMGGITMIAVEQGNPQTIYQDENLMVMMMGYTNMNMLTESEGQAYMAMIMNPSTGETASAIIEIVSLSNDTTEVATPITFLFGKYVQIGQLMGATEATSSDILAGKGAFDKNGNPIVGNLELPRTTSDELELERLVQENSNEVFRFDGSTDKYQYGYYKGSYDGETDTYVPRKVIELSKLSYPATRNDIIADKQAYDDNGEIIYGSMLGIQEIATEEEMNAIISGGNMPEYYFAKYVGDTTQYYTNGSVYMMRYGSDRNGGGLAIPYWEQLFTMGSAVRDNLSEATIPQRIKIGSSDFNRVSEGTTYLRAYCLANSNIETIEFVTIGTLWLANDCLRGCTNLKTLVIGSSHLPSGHNIQSEAFYTASLTDDNTTSLTSIYVRDELVEAYKADSAFVSVASIIKPMSEYVQ